MTQRTTHHTIGLILSNVTNDFSGYLIEEMSRKFHKNGYHLLVTVTDHSTDSECEMLRMFEKTTDGILFISDTLSYDDLSESIPQQIPVIFLNRRPDNCPHTCILENDYSAVFQSILSNSADGNDKIALVCHDREFSTTKEIISAYRDAMNSTSAGFHEDWIFCTDSKAGFNPETMLADMVEKGCNTVLTSTQTLTRKFWDYLLVYNRTAENPVALIGFANKGSHRQVNLSFDSIIQPLQELIDLSVQQMLYLIHNPDTPVREYLLKGTFRIHTLDVLTRDI